jgi:hypothetical protein
MIDRGEPGVAVAVRRRGIEIDLPVAAEISLVVDKIDQAVECAPEGGQATD